MGIFAAFKGAVSGTFADQWKDIYTAGYFDEFTVVSPGILKQPTNNRGSFNNATEGIITSGSRIYVPENTAAFIFSQSGIEEIITQPGGYVYTSGQDSIFNGDGITEAFLVPIVQRTTYGGQTPEYKQIAFVNLREIRGIRFGTRGPLMYHDMYYDADLAITAFGTFSLKIVDAERFIRCFIPANITYYSFDTPNARSQILAEFIQSFAVALNSLSSEYRISQLPAQANEITSQLIGDTSNAGTWKDRFGFEVISVGIESIEFSPESKELVNQYSSKKLDWKVYESVSQKSSNIAAQQKIAQGVQNHGLGNMPGMVLGMGLVQSINPQNAESIGQNSTATPDQQNGTVSCAKCGNTLPPDAKFCLECGQQVLAENEMICAACNLKTLKGKFCAQCGASLMKKCTQCGTEIPPNGKFCLECGYKFSAEFE